MRFYHIGDNVENLLPSMTGSVMVHNCDMVIEESKLFWREDRRFNFEHVEFVGTGGHPGGNGHW